MGRGPCQAGVGSTSGDAKAAPIAKVGVISGEGPTFVNPSMR